jgi:TolB protein
MIRRVLLCVVFLILAGCEQTTTAPVATPSSERAADRPTNQPIPTIPAPEGLPGRIVLAARGDLWLWQGEQATRLTTSGDAVQPALNQAGQIVFVRRSQSASDLEILDLAQNGNLKRLTFYTPEQPIGSIERVYESIWAWYPVWSPDGAQVAFVSQYGPPFGSPASDYRLGLYTMPAQPGADRSMQYTDQGGHVGRAAYAPDGSAILFSLAPDPPGVPQIYRLDLISGEAGSVPGMPEQSYDPAYAPDGSQIAFAARHAEGTDIFVLPTTGGEPIQVTRLGVARAPAFSPDGTQLAFLASPRGERGFDLWVIDLKPSIGEPRRISFDIDADPDSGISWGP